VLVLNAHYLIFDQKGNNSSVGQKRNKAPARIGLNKKRFFQIINGRDYKNKKKARINF
jgi:hypothetical protein